MSAHHIQLLQAMPVFGGVKEDTLEFLLARVRVVHREVGQYFIHQGEQPGAMFVLEHGRVEVLKTWSGNEYLLKHFGPGDNFGEMALIDLFPRSASIRAVEDSDALEISHEILFQLYEHDLEQFTIIQMNIAREISRRMRQLEERLFLKRVGAPASNRGRDTVTFRA